MSHTETPTFDEFLVLMKTIHDEKGKGYDGDRQYSNHWAITEIGMPGWASPFNRLNDKKERLRSVLRNPAAATFVNVEEEWLDIANNRDLVL